jgi:predicted dehydrogenase
VFVIHIFSTDRASTSVLQKKCDFFVRSAYEDTRVYKSLDDFVKNMTPQERPRVIVIGSPPMFRGTVQPGRDVEIQIMKHLSGVPMFIEKPIATGPETELQEVFKISKQISDSGTICSVGYVFGVLLLFVVVGFLCGLELMDRVYRYMLRYFKAVQMMKQIIIDNNLTVMSTIARYACAYESIAKPDWWMKSKSAGPIIEQGTHFCDLSCHFGGEVDINTVVAHSLE